MILHAVAIALTPLVHNNYAIYFSSEKGYYDQLTVICLVVISDVVLAVSLAQLSRDAAVSTFMAYINRMTVHTPCQDLERYLNKDSQHIMVGIKNGHLNSDQVSQISWTVKIGQYEHSDFATTIYAVKICTHPPHTPTHIPAYI